MAYCALPVPAQTIAPGPLLVDESVVEPPAQLVQLEKIELVRTAMKLGPGASVLAGQEGLLPGSAAPDETGLASRPRGQTVMGLEAVLDD